MAGWWTDEGDLLDMSGLMPPPTPFFGRRRELAALESAVGPGVRLGLYPEAEAGTGVSALLREVVRRADLSVLGWARESDGGLIARAIHRWGAVLGATAPPDDEEDGHLVRVLRALPRGEGTLVVLDGVDAGQRAELTRWLGLLPAEVGLLVAAESRDALPDGLDQFSVPPLQTVEALGLLRQEIGERLPQNLAVALADACGRLPLALQLVGRRRAVDGADEPLLLAEPPGGDAPELAATRRLGGNSAAVHAFLALYLSLPSESQQALRMLAAWPEGAWSVGPLAASLHLHLADVAAGMSLAQELALVRGVGGRWSLHPAVRGWLRELSRLLGEERALAAAVVGRGTTWQDLLVLTDAVERLRIAGDRDALLGMTERLVLGDGLLLRAGLYGRAQALAADVLRMPGPADRRAGALERWLRGGDVALVTAEAPTQRKVKRSRAVEALRAEVVEIAGEASIAAAEASARAAVWLEGGRGEAQGLEEGAVRTALRVLQELADRAEAAAQDAQTALDDVLFAPTAEAIQHAVARSQDAADQAARLSDEAQAAFDDLRAAAGQARAERARAQALRAAIAEAAEDAARVLDEAREQVRTRRGELPESLEPRMAAAWARVSPALSRAVHAMRELEADPEGDLQQAMVVARDAHARVVAGCREAVSAAEEAAELRRLAGEALAWRDELSALRVRAEEAAARFQVNQDRVRTTLGEFAGEDAEAAGMLAELQRMDGLVREARAELEGLAGDEAGREAARRRAQRAQTSIGRAAVDVLALLPGAEEIGRRLDEQNAARWLSSARARAAEERGAIEARLAELATHVGSVRDLPRARQDAGVRRSVEEVIAAHVTLETGVDVAVRALREVERCEDRTSGEPALQAALGHVASVKDAADRVVQLLGVLGLAVEQAESSELEAARKLAADHAHAAELAADRARAAREEAAALTAPMEGRNALVSLQRVVDAHERALFALGHARDAAERARVGARPADAQRAAVAAEGAARAADEAAEAADEALGRCRDLHATWVEDRRRASLLGEDLRARVARCRTSVQEEADTVAEVRRLTSEPVSASVADALRAAERWLAEARDALLHAEHAVAELTSQGDASASDRIITAAGAAINSLEEAMARIDDELVRARDAHADAVALRVRREELGQRLEVLLDETAAIVEAAARHVAAVDEVWSSEDPVLLVPAREELQRAEVGRERLRDLIGGLEELDAIGLNGRASEAEDVAEEVAAASERARALAEDAEREGRRLREQRARAAALAHEARAQAARDMLAGLRATAAARAAALARLQAERPWAAEAVGEGLQAAFGGVQTLDAKLDELSLREPVDAESELIGLQHRSESDPVSQLDEQLIRWELDQLRQMATRLTEIGARLESRSGGSDEALREEARQRRWSAAAVELAAWMGRLPRLPARVDLRAAVAAVAAEGAALEDEAAAAVEQARAERALRERLAVFRHTLDVIAAEHAAAEERVRALVQDALQDAEGVESHPAVSRTLGIARELPAAVPDPAVLRAGEEEARELVLERAGLLGQVLRRACIAVRATERLADEIRVATLARIQADRARADVLSTEALLIDEEVESERADAVAAAIDEPELRSVCALVEDSAAEVRERVGLTVDLAGVVSRAATVLQAREALARVEASAAMLHEAQSAFGVAVGAVRAGADAASLRRRERARESARAVVAAVRERVERVRGGLAELRYTIEGWLAEPVQALGVRGAAIEAVLQGLGIDLEELEAAVSEDVDASTLDLRSADALGAIGGVEGNLAGLQAEAEVVLAVALPIELVSLQDEVGGLIDQLNLGLGALEDRAGALAARAAGLDMDAPDAFARAQAALGAVHMALDDLRGAQQSIAHASARAQGVALVQGAHRDHDAAGEALQEASAALTELEAAAGSAEALRDARQSAERRLQERLHALAEAVDELELTLEATRAEFEAAGEGQRQRWSGLAGGQRALAVVTTRLQARVGELRGASDPAAVEGLVAGLVDEVEQRRGEAVALLDDLRSLVDAQIRLASDARDLLEGRIAVRRASAESTTLAARGRRAVELAMRAATRAEAARPEHARCRRSLLTMEAAEERIRRAAALVEGASASEVRGLRADAEGALEQLRGAVQMAAALAGRGEWLAGQADGAARAAREQAAHDLRARGLAVMTGAGRQIPDLGTRVRRLVQQAEPWTEPAVRVVIEELRTAMAQVERFHRAATAAAERAVRASLAEAAQPHVEVAERAASERALAVAQVQAGLRRAEEVIRQAHAARVEAREALIEHRRIAGEVSSRLQGEAGNVQRRVALFERGLGVARRKGDRAELRGWLVDLAELYLQVGRASEAALLLDEALPLATSERMSAEILQRMARAERGRDPRAAVELAERAVAASGASSASELAGLSLVELSHARRLAGETGAVEAAEAALVRFRSSSDGRLAGVAAVALAQALVAAGRLSEARAAAGAAEVDLLHAGDNRAAAGAGLLLAQVLRRLGETGAAVLAAERATGLLHDMDEAGAAQVELARAWTAAGHPHRALRLLHGAQDAEARVVSACASRAVGLGRVGWSPALALAASKDLRRRLRRGGRTGRLPDGQPSVAAMRAASASFERAAEAAVRRREDGAAALLLAQAAGVLREAALPEAAALAERARRAAERAATGREAALEVLRRSGGAGVG